MKHTRWALAIAVLAAAVVAASAMAFAGRDASATRPDLKARGSAPTVDDAVRFERRESFRHTGCSKRTERDTTLDV